MPRTSGSRALACQIFGHSARRRNYYTTTTGESAANRLPSWPGDRFELANSSGARDLNPGPHSPEPSWLHVLECPAGSAGGLLNSTAGAFVSSRDLIGPSGAANA